MDGSQTLLNPSASPFDVSVDWAADPFKLVTPISAKFCLARNPDMISKGDVLLRVSKKSCSFLTLFTLKVKLRFFS